MMIEELAEHVGQGKKRKASDKLLLKDFEELEAAESAKKKPSTVTKETKVPKIWSASESALLKVLMNGCPPIGKNASGKINLFCSALVFLFFVFCFLFYFACSNLSLTSRIDCNAQQRVGIFRN